MAKGSRARGVALILLCLAPISALSQSSSSNQTPPSTIPSHRETYFVLHAAAGQTVVPLFGDTDKRDNYLAGLSYVKPERFLKTGRKVGDLFQEVYYEHSVSKGGSGPRGNLPSDYEAVGYLFGDRQNWGIGRYGIYVDLGWGLQYNNHRTADLPSRLNSTPFLDVGFWIPNHRHPLLVGLRYLHSSNGGTVGSNTGQNQFFLDVGVKL